MRKTFLLRPIAVALMVATLTACSTSGPHQNVFHSTGNNFRANGLLITELQADTFGPGVARMTIKSQADAVAADKLIAFYAAKASQAVAKGDVEEFAVAWHLAKKLSAARVEQLVSTEAFVNSLAVAKNGTGTLPGGARVFLPKELYSSRQAVGANKKRASIDEMFMEFGDAVVSLTPDWANAPKLASLGSLLGVVGNMTETAGRLAGVKEPTRLDGSALEAMKVGSAYAVQDSLGNKYIVEKTADGIVLHNPDSAPTKIDLNQVNFMPILEKPEQYRYEAAKIVANRNRAEENAREAAVASRGVSITGVFTIPPNVFQLGDKVEYLNADGTLASSDLASVRILYSTNRAFKLAMDMGTRENLNNDNIYNKFSASCQYTAVLYHHGDALEYATYSCRDPKNQITYSRTYVVGNGFSAQSWDSLLKDKTYTDAMKNASRSARVAESIAAVVPFVGNVDAAAKCASGESVVFHLAKAALAPNMNSDVRRFITYSEEQETASTVGKALDCTQGIGAIGAVRGALSGGANLLKLSNGLTSPQYKKATEIMSLFDTRLYSKARFEGILDKLRDFSSPSAALMTKVFYDQAQHANNLGELYEAVSKKVAG